MEDKFKIALEAIRAEEAILRTEFKELISRYQERTGMNVKIDNSDYGYFIKLTNHPD